VTPTKVLRNIISNNILDGCNVGVFLESSGDTNVEDNTIDNPVVADIYLNQISTPSTNNIITGNKLKDTAGGHVGIYFNNNAGQSLVADNFFIGEKYSIYSDVGAGVDIEDNYHSGITQALFGIAQGTTTSIWNHMVQQHFMGTRNSTTGVPFTASPLDNPNNSSSRAPLTTILPMWQLQANAAASSLDAEYQSGTQTMTTDCAGFAGAYSLYINSMTLVCNTASNFVVGDYVEIGSVLYYLAANPSGGEYQVQSYAKSDGDFTAAINAASANVTSYFPSWQEN